MPVTSHTYPILSHFLCVVESTTGMPVQPAEAEPATAMATPTDDAPKKLPKGVVLGPDGKPCRSCTSFASWAAMTKKHNTSASSSAATAGGVTATSSTSNISLSSTASSLPAANDDDKNSRGPPPDCPPDVDALGRSAWTLLHTMAATYPERPSAGQQQDARQFVSSFSRLYPCWTCAEDFRAWLAEGRNAPRVSSRGEFGHWMCEAHNAVNEKLGKDRFDCGRWEERWRTGWRDGSCD